MRIHVRSAAVLGLFALLSGSAFGAGRPNIDVFGDRPRNQGGEAALIKKAEAAVNPGVRIQTESRLGVPTFLWVDGSNGASLAAARSRSALGTGAPAESAARAVLSQFASLYSLSAPDVSGAVVSMVHDTGTGPIIVKFSQRIGGIDVFREEINVLMNRKLEGVAISGYIASAATPPAQGGAMSFALGATAAAASAISDVTGAGITASHLVSLGSRDGYDLYTLSGPAAALLDERVRVQKVYYHLPEGLEAGYFVEVIARTPDDSVATLDGTATSVEGYSYVISAANGAVLFRKNLSNDEKARTAGRKALVGSPFSYRVWADPITMIPYDTPAGNAPHPKVVAAPDGGQAPFVSQSDVTLSNFPFSMNDPWLAPGATETVGNNADAFVNLVAPDGYGPVMAPPADPATGDFRAQITAPGQFLHTAVADAEPKLAEARQSDVQQLFYNVNFLHDWFYDAGFDEASRNGQVDNYGRGGAAGDDMKAQAQDVQSRNNANMLTPADGTRSRMRMYLFDNNAIRYVDVLSPPAAAGQRAVGTGQFGQQVFDVTNQLVQPITPAGCTAGDYAGTAGKFVMVDRQPTSGAGSCSIGTKLNTAMAAGVSGFILVNLSTAPDTLVNVTGSLPTFTIPFLTITWNGAATIKTELAVPNVVTARMRRDGGVDRDGTIDNQIVFHEWGHFLSNRLIGNASGLFTQHSAGMGEGWGDFLAMLLTVRPDDTATPSNATWNGVYSLATYATSGGANNGYYFGIRRYPYSTDMTKNPLTFTHIQNGVPLPVGPPLAFGASGASNAEVHNTGEVWTSMLWECYAALLRDTQGPTPRLTFQQAQDRMKLYLVASMKMTPGAPTFTEARDAVLAAAYATDAVDFAEFWQAFAKRGAGIGAVSPDRFSSTNIPVVESFVTGPGLVYVSAVLDDGVASCDADGILDSGERGHLVVTLRNAGTTILTGTTATITTTSPDVTFPNGNVITFASSDPAATTTGTVIVAFAPGIAGIQQLDFQIDYNDPQLGGPPLTASVGLRANASEIPASTATDAVEAGTSLWAVSSNPTLGPIGPWARKAVTPLQHVWHGTDSGAASDEYLTSPVFTVDGGGSMNVQFDHSWGFEFDGGGNYDGGVVEMSVNGGAFTDIGATGTGTYNGAILNNPGGLNPLSNRPGYVQNSAGNVHTSLTQAIAPGSTVQVRFRLGTDSSVGAAGWDVDNIAFTGVVETPFATLVADPGCALTTTTTLATSANPSPFADPLTLTATVASAGGAPNAGTVTFFDGATPLGSPSVSAGVATLITSSLSQGTHNLTAHYDGASGFAPSTSNTVVEVIGKPATTVLVVSSQNPSALSQSVTFTATVSALTGTPTGSVAFSDGATPLATVALTGGVATYTTSALAGGTHTINAAYAGNTTHAASTGSVSQVVTNPTINASGTTTFCAGGSVTLTASIAPGAGVSYLWSPNSETTQAIVVTASGSYSVTVTVNGVPGTSAPTVVTVNPVPATAVITAPSTALPGETGLVASVPNNAGSTYAWGITNGSITAGAGTNQVTFTAGVSGPLGLTVIETNASGCPSAQASATVNVATISYVLHVVAPCRVLDTRNASGADAGAPALASGEARLIDVNGRCGVPATAKAIAVNVTVIGGSSGGVVVLYPGNLIPAIPVGISNFFNPNRARAVNGLLQLDVTGFKAHNMSATATHVLVDVNGWFE